MNRPRTIWLIFGACLAVLLAATGWVTLTALRLERLQAQAQKDAAQEEKIRLALWRMDSMLGPLIAQESVRPHFVYNAYYPIELSQGKVTSSPDRSTSLVPSPLLGQTSSNILLHFQIEPGGRLTSPESPEGPQRELAAQQPGWRSAMDTAARRLKDFDALLKTSSLRQQTAWTRGSNRDLLLAGVPQAAPSSINVADNFYNSYSQQQLPSYRSSNPVQMPQTQQATPQAEQVSRNQGELQARAQSIQQALELSVQNNRVITVPNTATNVSQGAFGTVWIADTPVLARRVVVRGQEYIQGCWLDWPEMKRWLLESVRDLVPGATLQPLEQSPGTEAQGHLLASIPARLVPDSYESSWRAAPSPMTVVLALAWCCMILATAAVGILLHGVISLSERRAMFVSAVSHELRTPLTTFKMYSEMLAEGMVPTETGRQQYLRTLCSEANRLGHLVENVLAYSRLERGSARARVEEITLGQLLDRIRPRLEDRAAQAGLRIMQKTSGKALDANLCIDVTAVEQILFNLIDNACKYAANAEPQNTIDIEIDESAGGSVAIRIRDHGQGLSSDALRRLFRPFGKSAQEAAKEKPGVGLGLALSLRLSQSLGGSLRLIDNNVRGACFELKLPARLE